MVKREGFQTVIHDSTPDGEQFNQEILLLFVLEGSLKVSVENKISDLDMEDILVINANKRYSLRSGKNVLYMTLSIDYASVVDTMEDGDVIFLCNSSMKGNEEAYAQLRTRIRHMLNHFVEAGEPGRSFAYFSDCYGILNDLAANFRIKVNDLGSLETSDRYEDRIRQIDNYIHANYDQPISMREMSEKMFLSNGYLSRFFKKNYGMSFASYLTNVRLYHAVDDLIHSDAPITRVAYNNGFTSAALFNKVFRKAYGLSPSEFRKNSEGQAGEEAGEKHKKELENRLGKALAILPAEEDTRLHTRVCETVFSAKSYEPLKPYWGEIINFGDASHLLNSTIREHLYMLKQAFGFKYVRFSNIFSHMTLIDLEKKENYNFGPVDSILDYILDQGMLPFIELGLKPKLIHYQIGERAIDEKQMELNRTIKLEQWERLLTAFMNHLSSRYGQDVLDDWIMEFWYDEDWRLEPEKYNKRYMDVFQSSWEIIKACNEKIRFGGYSIRMDIGHARRKEFLEYWNRQEHRPDFISIMYYGYERGEDGLDRYARRTTDNDAMVHLLTGEKKLIEEAGMGDVPIIVNEWNMTPSTRNYINDSAFKGAYIVKNVIDVYGMAESMGYGAGSDSEYDSYDTADLLFGGTGLISRDGVLKPAAFAFDFLNNRLYPYYMGKSRNYLVTTDSHDNYAIVCHNQQMLNYNYYLTGEMDLERDSMWKYFEGRNKLNLQVRLKDVTDGTYRVKIHRISDSCGSVLDIWKAMDFEKNLSRNDIKYLRRACEPELTIRKIGAVNGILTVEEELAPNEICVIHVRREA